MRIGLNLLHAQPSIGGGWNYIANLVGGLADLVTDHEFVAFATDVSAAIVPTHPRIQVVTLPVHAASRTQRILFENVQLPAIARRMRVDVLHWFSNTRSPFSRIPSVVTIYDLLAYTPDAPWGPLKLAYLRFMIRYAVRTADLLLPISQATADDVQRTLGAPPSRMTVIPAVLPTQVAPAASQEVDRLRQVHGLPAQYWLYVAHFYAHKNHQTLIEAYRRLQRLPGSEDWPLVLRGDGPAGTTRARQQVAEAGLEGRVIFLPRLGEGELRALYTGAAALVFPSTYEGLGIPVLEAMACGCPVIAGPVPAVVESAGDAVHTIDQHSADSLAEAMRCLQSDPGRRQALRQRGLARAREFRADRVVPRLLRAYEQVGRGGAAVQSA